MKQGTLHPTKSHSLRPTVSSCLILSSSFLSLQTLPASVPCAVRILVVHAGWQSCSMIGPPAFRAEADGMSWLR